MAEGPNKASPPGGHFTSSTSPGFHDLSKNLRRAVEADPRKPAFARARVILASPKRLGHSVRSSRYFNFCMSFFEGNLGIVPIYPTVFQSVGQSTPESFLWPKDREDPIAKSKSRRNRHQKRKHLHSPHLLPLSVPRQRVGSGRDLRQLSGVLFAGPFALSGAGVCSVTLRHPYGMRRHEPRAARVRSAL